MTSSRTRPTVYEKPSVWKKITKLVREQGPLGTFRHIRAILWLRVHAWWDRQSRDGLTHDKTASIVSLDDVSISGQNRGAGIDYEPTPWSVLNWVQETLPKPTPQWSFVDLGAGKGRVVSHASRLPYGKVIGVEFAYELVQIAKEQIDLAQNIRANSVEIINQDAAEYELPTTSLVVFLFNPFDPPVIERVAESIAQSYKTAPRPIYIAYLNPRHHCVFDRLIDFKLVKKRLATSMKVKLLSPNDLRVYATQEALDTDTS